MCVSFRYARFSRYLIYLLRQPIRPYSAQGIRCGMCMIPRAEAFGLSYIYRITYSETAVYFVLPVLALVLGVIADRMLRGDLKASVNFHKTLAVLICLDLVIRIVPVRANLAFGIPAAIAGFAVRAACLYLVICDLKAEAQ